MLRINLASGADSASYETQSSRWYIMDLVVLLAAAGVGYLAVQYYIGAAKDSIEIVESETKSIRDSIAKLQETINRYDTLEVDIRQLVNKIEAIKSITVSVFERYKLLIVLEHLQVLQPNGVWYDSLNIKEETINVKGAAFNNILVAEFLTALESTKTQEVDPADLRSYVYFDNSTLLSTTAVGDDSNKDGDNKYSVGFGINIDFKSQSYEQVLDENSKELAVDDAGGI